MADSSAAAPDSVTVVYALPDEQHFVEVPFAAGLTAREAVMRSGLTDRFAQIAAAPLIVGVFGRLVDPDAPLQAGARVELCRPLQRDPRELRRIMTARGLVMGQRGSNRS